jgi:hypothetical protein
MYPLFYAVVRAVRKMSVVFDNVGTVVIRLHFPKLGDTMATITATDKWTGIESEELDSSNWVQVGYRNAVNGTREYLVLGEVCGVRFEESYHSDTDDNKRLAYSLYWETLDKFQ